MVCWNESSHAARAVTVATPILAKAKRAVFVTVAERADAVPDGVEDLARQFAWNGVAAEVLVKSASRRTVPDVLAAAGEERGGTSW